MIQVIFTYISHNIIIQIFFQIKTEQKIILFKQFFKQISNDIQTQKVNKNISNYVKMG